MYVAQTVVERLANSSELSRLALGKTVPPAAGQIARASQVPTDLAHAHVRRQQDPGP